MIVCTAFTHVPFGGHTNFFEQNQVLQTNVFFYYDQVLLALARRLLQICSRGQYNVCSAFIGFEYECSVAALDSFESDSVGPEAPDGIRTETVTRVRPDGTSEIVRLSICCLMLLSACVRPGLWVFNLFSLACSDASENVLS